MPQKEKWKKNKKLKRSKWKWNWNWSELGFQCSVGVKQSVFAQWSNRKEELFGFFERVGNFNGRLELESLRILFE